MAPQSMKSDCFMCGVHRFAAMKPLWMALLLVCSVFSGCFGAEEPQGLDPDADEDGD